MDWFKKRREADVTNAVEAVEKATKLNKIMEDTLLEEWIWVSGYKGTDKDMKCRDYQFELNKQFDISDDEPVELCAHGFHLCAKLSAVFGYYGIHSNNRFFEVKALVRKSDYESLGPVYYTDHHGFKSRMGEKDKLVAKSIIFTRELTADEILMGRIPDDWTVEQKQLALDIGIHETNRKIALEKLIALGYSETFAKLLIEQKKADTAISVGTQEGLSMDMKVWLIFNISKK